MRVHEQDRRDAVPTRRRVLLGVVAVAVLVTLLAIPRVQDELRHTFTRQPAVFTELSFVGDGPTVARSPDGGQRVVVRFALVNHGGDPSQDYVYRVRALGAGGAVLAESSRAVSVPVDRPTAFDVRLDVPVPDRYAEVTVELDDRPERLRHRAVPEEG